MAETTEPAESESLDYKTALTELDGILAELEDESLDVDVLADRVERAATLIKFCRARIIGAKTQVDKIVANLDELGDQTT